MTRRWDKKGSTQPHQHMVTAHCGYGRNEAKNMDTRYRRRTIKGRMMRINFWYILVHGARIKTRK